MVQLNPSACFTPKANYRMRYIGIREAFIRVRCCSSVQAVDIDKWGFGSKTRAEEIKVPVNGKYNFFIHHPM